MQLQQQFLQPKDGPELRFVESTRKFLKETTFKKVTKGNTPIKNCTVILFNDMILLALKKGKDADTRYKPKSDKIPIDGVLVWDEKQVENGFTLVWSSPQIDKLTMSASCMEEKLEWMDTIHEALVNLPNVRFLRSQQTNQRVELITMRQ